MKKSLKSKSAVSMILVAAIIVIIVIAGAAGAYIIMTQPSASPTPSPTATPTATPSETATPAPTASPTAAPILSPVANFKAGAYAIYNTTTVSNGVTAVAELNFTISEASVGETPCWVMTMVAGNQSEYVLMTINFDKTNTSKLLGNVTMKMVSGGAVIQDISMEAASAGATGVGTEAVNPAAIVGYEAVTVVAGTFQNCAKAVTTSTNTSGETEVATLWVSSSVPVFGLVKGDSVVNGATVSTLELISYGGYP